MKKLLSSFVFLSIFFNCFAQNTIEKRAKSLLGKGKCNQALAVLMSNNIFSGPLFNDAKKCIPPPKQGNTADAQEFDPETDDLTMLPKLAGPLGNENITNGNRACKKGDFAAALRFYRSYLRDNLEIFVNEQYEDYLDNMMRKIEYCIDKG